MDDLAVVSTRTGGDIVKREKLTLSLRFRLTLNALRELWSDLFSE